MSAFTITGGTRRYFASAARATIRDVYILSAARTPIGAFNGALSSVSAVELGRQAAVAAVRRARIPTAAVEETIFGQVLQGDCKQAPARQVGILANFPTSSEAMTVNKVCASGLKAVALAAQTVCLGDRSLVVAGGMESMSQTPYYVKRGLNFGNSMLKDSIVSDALTDAYDSVHMGICCEASNDKYGITREDQDAYAVMSYKRAQAAQAAGLFDEEIVPVEVKGRKGAVTLVKEDESVSQVNFDKISTLRPAFKKDGSVTAANSSSINDGAAAVVVASGQIARSLGASVLGRIVAYADAAVPPLEFTMAPSLAIPRLLDQAGLLKSEISAWEINEAFAGVSILNNQRLELDPAIVNARGGAVAMGHPVGASGARILTTLLYRLKEGQFGVAAICNGGGGATTMLVQRMSAIQ